MRQFSTHLRKQYSDRTVYWQGRAQSRLCQIMPTGDVVVSMIIDALDHSKMRLPRSVCLSSKDFSAFARPSLDLTACLVHGRAVHVNMTMPFVAKDSNLSNDIISHSLHALAVDGLDLRTLDLRVQCDNTVRETKNNTTLRALACLVASSRIKRASLQSLVTGHSHEDVDAFLALVANAIQSSKEIHSPSEFQEVLRKFLQSNRVRPYESSRSVHLISAVRDWTLSSS